MRKRRRGRRYRIKPRFYLIIFLLVIVISSTCFILFNKTTPYEQGEEIVSASRLYISNKDLVYDGSYIEGGYPPDDIGVCTDVVWKGLLSQNINLRADVSGDIGCREEAYCEVIEVPDANIDFRRVDVLEIYMNSKYEVLDNNPLNFLEWMPGDFVTFDSSHIAVVSDFTNIWGIPYIIQHGKDPAGEEDRLINPDYTAITGHYRLPVKKWLK